MRRFCLTILGTLVICAPTSGLASDVGAVVAPMKTEAEECRYLLNLCVREKTLRDKFMNQSVTDADGSLQDKVTAGNAWESVAAQVVDAATIIRSKHAKRPACFAKCPALNGAPAFE